jgi:hypothetical protein
MKTVFDSEFKQFGKVIQGYDVKPLLQVLAEETQCPADHVIYIPSDVSLEALPVARAIESGVFGGISIQVGYCNGSNRQLNCLEYHRCSEVNIPCEDIILLVAPLQRVQEGILSTGEAEAFLAPAGTMVLLYETTLHYAPCNGPQNSAFRVAVLLPKGTNTEKPQIELYNEEDRLLWACNKWLIAHPESFEASQGAFIGLTGENLRV